MLYRVFKPITSLSTRTWLINPPPSPAHERRVAYSQVSRGDWPRGSAISLGLNSQLAETLGATVRQPLVISHWHFGCCSDGIVGWYSDWIGHFIESLEKIWDVGGDSELWNQTNRIVKVWPVWWINAFSSIILNLYLSVTPSWKVFIS